MSRLLQLDLQTAGSEAKELLEKTQSQLGRIPNLYKAMANSPASLDGYLSFRSALASGKLTLTMREHLALLVAEENHCEYCVSAHMFRGQKIGISAEDLKKTRKAESSDPKIQAALKFASTVLNKKGAVSDNELEALRLAGWSDSEMVEIVAHVALNVFSNYFNHVALPDLDFPKVSFSEKE